MDLRELYRLDSARHPWEISRVKALLRLLSPVLLDGARVLDIGCGDGYVSRALLTANPNGKYTAVDIHLTDELILELHDYSTGIRYSREIPEGAYDLLLLLDIVEHVENDRQFVANLVSRHLAGNGWVMITVPAFQSLFGRHDRFLGHYRRYSLSQLMLLTEKSGLDVDSSGYLFSSLLLPKLVVFNLLTSGKESGGVGNWRRGAFVTRCVELILNLDNAIMIAASRVGIRIPGLTGWVLCRKHES